jgi:hypothetical protein
MRAIIASSLQSLVRIDFVAHSGDFAGSVCNDEIGTRLMGLEPADLRRSESPDRRNRHWIWL